jgi:hypothetical protein
MPEEVKPESHTQEEWKSIVTEAQQTRDAAKAKLEEVHTNYKALVAEKERLASIVKQREIQETQTKEQQQKAELEQQGKYQEALKLTETKWGEKYTNLQRSAAQRLVPLAITQAAAKVENITPEAIDLLPDVLAKHIDINPDTLEVYVKDENGKPMTEKGSMKPISVDDFVKAFVTSKTIFLKDAMPVKHGLGTSGKAITIEQAMADPKLAKEWATNDPAGFQAAMDAKYKRNNRT